MAMGRLGSPSGRYRRLVAIGIPRGNTMSSVRASLLSSAALCLLLAAGSAGAATPAPMLLAQAATGGAAEPQANPNDPIAIAQKEVDEARTALRQAMAAGGDVRAARRALQ